MSDLTLKNRGRGDQKRKIDEHFKKRGDMAATNKTVPYLKGKLRQKTRHKNLKKKDDSRTKKIKVTKP